MAQKVVFSNSKLKALAGYKLVDCEVTSDADGEVLILTFDKPDGDNELELWVDTHGDLQVHVD